MDPRLSDGHSLAKYFDLIRDLPLLTVEEERSNGRIWQRDRNPEGLRMLVEGNLRFVVKVALKFRGRGLDLLDLISEGNLGLVEAAKRFDPEREYKFITYAVWWVRQAIFHALAEHGGKISLPEKVAWQIAKLNRITQQLEQNLGRPPNSQEITKVSSFSIGEVERLQRLHVTVTLVSTDASFGDSTFTLADSIEQTTARSALDILDQEAFLKQLQLGLAMLTEKQRLVIDLHFGLDGREPTTLEDIGQSFMPPISRERVRQIEAGAFKKIRERRKDLLGQFLLASFAAGA